MIALAVTLALLPVKHAAAAVEASSSPPAAATQPSLRTEVKAPTSAPVDHDATVSVHRGTLTAAVDAQGYFEPIDEFDVRIRPKAYGGELKIVSIVANGAKVKKGDVLLEIDPKSIDRQISAARNEDEAARAALARAQADAKIGRDQDELALRMQADASNHAQEAVKWFENVDGPNLLKSVDLELKFDRSLVEDQEDELNELKKMYKSEDLTTDTADIVVKRAVRRLEMTKAEMQMEEERATKIKTFIYPIDKQRVYDAAKQAQEQLAATKSAQAQTKVLRETGLKSAQAAAETAAERLSDLQADREALMIHAPADGVVLYGQFAGGGFNPIDPRTLVVGERIAPQQSVMTFYTPGKLRLHLDLPEQKFFQISAGTKATVTPAVFPDQKLAGTCEPAPAADVNTQQGPLYRVAVSIPDTNAMLAPGMRANFHADVPEAKDALLVPNSSIANGCVWVKDEDGDQEKRSVVTGKSDGKQTEIKQGLTEGEEIFVEARK